jgi:prepilin-type N-terminal cleavage/methylation domain-containing protein
MQRIGMTTSGRRTARVRKDCAFTLVELLVAITISSLLVVAVVSATRALSASRQSVERRAASSAAARRALETIVGALRNVRCDPVRGTPVVVGHAGDAAGNAARIDLLVIGDRRVRSAGPESDQHEVSFYLAKLPQQPLPVLLCRRDHALDEHPDEGGIATVVAEGVIGLSFAYYADGRWRDDWPSAEPRAPHAVRVTVAALGADAGAAPGPANPCVLTTTVPLRVNPASEPPAPQPEGPPTGPTGGPPAEMGGYEE